jgi:2-polyprenyl-3-methyl-5-hydroxy-6-metoxy-1,4-benzoquinol methylase
MNKVENLYDKDYCIKNVKKLWRYTVVPQVVRVLFHHFKPCSVIDFGCANGLHIAEFKTLGAECFGVEGSLHYRKYIEENYDGDYAIADLRFSFDLEKSFDLATCIEVLEHIDEDFAQVAVDNIRRHSNTLCITASRVTNARYHVNGREKSYWIEKFESKGEFEFQADETELLQKVFQKLDHSPIWMQEDLMIFRRRLN